MNHYEVNLSKEGFVKVIQRGKISSTKNKSLKDYLFYLTFNNRADILSNKNFLFKNPYNYIKNVKEQLKNTKGNTIHSLELIMSFSSSFNKIVGIYYGSDNWKKIYKKEVEAILNKNLSNYVNRTSFYHDYDSTLYRIHNHTLILPYINEKKQINNKSLELKLLKPYIEKEVLINLKNNMNLLAKKIWKTIPPSLKQNQKSILNDFQRNFKKTQNILKGNVKTINLRNPFWDILENNLLKKEDTEKYLYLIKSNQKELFLINKEWEEDFVCYQSLIDSLYETTKENCSVFKNIDFFYESLLETTIKNRNQWLLLKLLTVLININYDYKKYNSKINNIFTVGKDYKYIYETFFKNKKELYSNPIDIKNEKYFKNEKYLINK